MCSLDLETIDYRSIRFLKELIETGSVSQAGESFGLSQPAASRTLKRLRDAINDPILVRGRRGLVLTERVTALKGAVGELVLSFDRVFMNQPFEPATAQRLFHIGATDYSMATVAPGLMRRIYVEAPEVVVQFHPVTSATLSDLESGLLDLAYWGGSPPPVPYQSKELFREHAIGVVCRGHPLAQGPVTLDGFLSYPHVKVSVGQPGPGPIDEALQAMDRARRVAFVVGHFSTAMAALAGTDLVMALPSRLAGVASEQGLATFDLPLRLPEYPYLLIWHHRSDGDPALDWLRGLVR